MEINEWSSQSLNAFIEKGESLEPFSTYMRLAYNFNRILFGDDPDDGQDELQEYEPTDHEREERYFEYYEFKDSKAVLIED